MKRSPRLEKGIVYASLLALCAFCTTHALADYRAGLAAYQRGDYETARDNWMPEAQAGDELA